MVLLRPMLFFPNDEVEFELEYDGNGGAGLWPRWDGDIDRGHSGEWRNGRVIGWDGRDQLNIEYESPGNKQSIVWAWPLNGFGRHRPGWVRKKTKPITKICECGGAKLNLTHSNWCPLYE